MKAVLLVFLGGGIGSVSRFILGRWINSLTSPNFPIATFLINIVACLILGFILGLGGDRQAVMNSTRLFWIVGFCGGFSTFSAFSSESLTLLQNGQYATMFFYVIFSVLLCLAAVSLGLLISFKI